MRQMLLLFLAGALLLGAAGCRFHSEKYWGLPATYGLHDSMDRGVMPDGWIQFYAVTTLVDLLLLPVTAVHDLYIAIFDPPHRFRWEEQRLERQMVHGY